MVLVGLIVVLEPFASVRRRAATAAFSGLRRRAHPCECVTAWRALRAHAGPADRCAPPSPRTPDITITTPAFPPSRLPRPSFFFFLNDPAPPNISPFPLPDPLPT